MLDVEAVAAAAGERWRIQWHEKVESTNDLALAAAAAGEQEGLVVGAESQTAGRGRRGRRWQDVPGACLLFSVLLRPPDGVRQLVGLTAAVAVADAAAHFGARLGLRWPNDLWWRGRKVCGILAEVAGGAVVVGIGVNVTAAPQVEGGTVPGSLCQAAGQPIAREAMLARILEALAQRYEELKRRPRAVVEAARAIDELAGKEVVVAVGRRQVVGTSKGIGDDGRLELEVGGKVVRVAAGEFVYVREA